MIISFIDFESVFISNYKYFQKFILINLFVLSAIQF